MYGVVGQLGLSIHMHDKVLYISHAWYCLVANNTMAELALALEHDNWPAYARRTNSAQQETYIHQSTPCNPHTARCRRRACRPPTCFTEEPIRAIVIGIENLVLWPGLATCSKGNTALGPSGLGSGAGLPESSGQRWME